MLFEGLKVYETYSFTEIFSCIYKDFQISDVILVIQFFLRYFKEFKIKSLIFVLWATLRIVSPFLPNLFSSQLLHCYFSWFPSSRHFSQPHFIYILHFSSESCAVTGASWSGSCHETGGREKPSHNIFSSNKWDVEVRRQWSIPNGWVWKTGDNFIINKKTLFSFN